MAHAVAEGHCEIEQTTLTDAELWFPGLDTFSYLRYSQIEIFLGSFFLTFFFSFHKYAHSIGMAHAKISVRAIAIPGNRPVKRGVSWRSADWNAQEIR